jgi:hypothetical protein
LVACERELTLEAHPQMWTALHEKMAMCDGGDVEHDLEHGRLAIMGYDSLAATQPEGLSEEQRLSSCTARINHARKLLLSSEMAGDVERREIRRREALALLLALQSLPDASSDLKRVVAPMIAAAREGHAVN